MFLHSVYDYTCNTIASIYDKKKWEESLIDMEKVKQEESEEKVEIVIRNMRLSGLKHHFRYGILNPNMQCKMM